MDSKQYDPRKDPCVADYRSPAEIAIDKEIWDWQYDMACRNAYDDPISLRQIEKLRQAREIIISR